MSDPVSAAKSARESLARALAAIQSDPAIPAGIMAIAEPISRAMGALFQVEQSGGAAAATSAPAALDFVRQALGQLQQQPSSHPAVERALEAVASSLGIIHGLASTKPQPAAQPARPAAAPTQPQPAAPPAPAYAQPQPAPAQPVYAQPQPAPAQPIYAQPAAPAQQPVQSPQAYAATYMAPAPAGAPPVAAPPPAPAPPLHVPPAYQATVAQQAPAAPAPHPATRAAVPQAPAGNGPVPRVEAELGAHSASNFYKGLSGNDVIEHGGLFIATYNIPRVGQPVTVHVSMPGGYEFDAIAIVRWTRETVDSSHGHSAQPGFGAQFTQISQDARQLVYRYVRNREPLFHDDM